MRNGVGSHAGDSARRETRNRRDRLREAIEERLARALDEGDLPPGADPKTHSAIRPYDGIVPPGGNWREAFAEGLACKW